MIKIKGEDLKKRSSDKNPPPILRFGKNRKGIGIPLLVDAAKDPMTFSCLHPLEPPTRRSTWLYSHIGSYE